MTVLRLNSLSKSFLEAGKNLQVLKNISMEIAAGEMVALLGASGSGKTTLLQLAGLLSTPDSGEIWLKDHNASHASDYQRTLWRRKEIGFIYQFHHLLPEFTALENVILPQLVAGISRKQAKSHAETLLDSLGLSARLSHRPSQLSGGEQQRVAIARAMANSPSIILADEPTGNLDQETAQTIFEAIKKLVKEQNTALLVVTHDTNLAEKTDRTLRIESGEIAANAA